MGFGLAEKQRERLQFEGGCKCPKCNNGVLVNVDCLSTPFTFCNACGKLYCAQCGRWAIRSSTAGKYICQCCSGISVYVFLPLLPDGEVVEVTSADFKCGNFQSEGDIIAFASKKINGS